MNDEKNYFKFVDEERVHSYDGLVWVQVARCLFTGSQDTVHSGKVSIQTETGDTKEIIMPDWRMIFINSVNMLSSLCSIKMQNPVMAEDYASARRLFLDLLQHLRKDGIFGYKNVVEVIGDEKS